ncbi:uncharacterized protein LOC115765367 [Drosophila novamexicana]|uniref:uncharacterized protein LOC115765367 n=1 Tax=Drosophila novamexicana TaxID=47314 RepID=UPI0011E5F285|nr:uncharacterized protein LOC115765367 [Drosophila novamexicana]
MLNFLHFRFSNGQPAGDGHITFPPMPFYAILMNSSRPHILKCAFSYVEEAASTCRRRLRLAGGGCFDEEDDVAASTKRKGLCHGGVGRFEMVMASVAAWR